MPETDLALLTAAAMKAGTLARQFFGQDPHVIQKPDGAGPVTEADLQVDSLLRDTLCAARPAYGWLSEESPDTDARLGVTTQFIVDPIDGTRAFINGSKDWAHSLAIVEDGQVRAGVVYLPMHALLFTATVGGGAFLNGQPIRASGATSDATLLATKPNFEPHWWKNGTPPDVTRAFRSSLAYRLSLVAQGRFDGMLTLRPCWEWDIAAGALIVSEAGGKVSDQHDKPLRFNNPHPMVPGVVAAGHGLHGALVSQLEPAARAE